MTLMDYEVYPEALEHVIRRVNKEMPGVDIIVTENGIATSDDDRRCAFIKEAVASVMDAKKKLSLATMESTVLYVIGDSKTPRLVRITGKSDLLT